MFNGLRPLGTVKKDEDTSYLDVPTHELPLEVAGVREMVEIVEERLKSCVRNSLPFKTLLSEMFRCPSREDTTLEGITVARVMVVARSTDKTEVFGVLGSEEIYTFLVAVEKTDGEHALWDQFESTVTEKKHFKQTKESVLLLDLLADSSITLRQLVTGISELNARMVEILAQIKKDVNSLKKLS